jgi:tyrocidine synthetase-3
MSERVNSELESLPRDFERAAVYAKSCVVVDLPVELCRRTIRTTGDSPFLLYTALFTALSVCLQKYSGNRTITIGSPALIELGEVRAIAITNEIDPQMSFKQVLLNTKKVLLEAYAKTGEESFAVAALLQGLHGSLPELSTDRTIVFARTGDEIRAEIEYNSSLFKKETIERFGGHLVSALSAGLSAVDVPVS